MSDDKKLEAQEYKMEFGPIIDLAPLPAEVVDYATTLFDTNLDGEISKQEAQANDAHESLFQVLTKLGVSADDLAIALGIEPKAVREKRQAEDRAERERMRKDWEEGQKFDRAEREKIRPAPAPAPTPAPAPAPAPAPVDPAAAGWSAGVVMKSSTELELTITNGSKLKGVAYRRITDPKTNKVLSEGSRTIGAGLIEPQVYNRSAGWPANAVVSVRLNNPYTGPDIKVASK